MLWLEHLPVRDSLHVALEQPLRDNATRVRIARPLSADGLKAASDLYARLQRLAARGITHLVDLTTCPSPTLPFMLKTWQEISNTGSTRRGDNLPRWICEEALLSIPDSILTSIHAATAQHNSHPNLTLLDLCNQSDYPPGTWIRIHDTPFVAEITQCDDTHLTLGPCFEARPDRKLIPTTSSNPPTPVGCSIAPYKQRF